MAFQEVCFAPAVVLKKQPIKVVVAIWFLCTGYKHQHKYLIHFFHGNQYNMYIHVMVLCAEEPNSVTTVLVF